MRPLLGASLLSRWVSSPQLAFVQLWKGMFLEDCETGLRLTIPP